MFDRIAMLDWSANSTPKTGTDSIWLAVHEDGVCRVENLPTRRMALAAVAGLARPGQRTLLGVDFSLGYPSGTAHALGLIGTPWEQTWKMLGCDIDDDERNRNNRFEVASALNAAMGSTLSCTSGPFWGCPPSRVSGTLTATKPIRNDAWPLNWRRVEAALRERGQYPFSSWQLLGAGSVGSQSLLGIAALDRLRWNLGARMGVWPFTTGLTAPDLDIELVVAEVWPSLWPVEVPAGAVKDAAQVEATAHRVADVNESGRLASWFSPTMSSDAAADVIGEEGWVLGVESELDSA